MDHQASSLQSAIADSDMTTIFDDPSFDTLNHDSFDPSASATFDHSSFLNTNNDSLFDDSIKSPLNVGHDFMYDRPPESSLFHNRPLPDASLIPDKTHHGSSTSARSSSNELSPDSRSGFKTTDTDSESPPSMTPLGLNAPLKLDDSVKFEHGTFSNAAASQHQQRQHWSTFGPQFSLGNEFDVDTDALLNSTFDPSTSGFAVASANLAANNDPALLSSPLRTAMGTDYLFGTGPAQSTSRSTSLSTGSTTSPSRTFALPSAVQPMSDMNDLYSPDQNMAQGPIWTQMATTLDMSDGPGMTTPPSKATGSTIAAVSNLPAANRLKDGRIPMHIAPIADKSRVETQINIRITLDYLPPDVTLLHLPKHTIAKSKLIASDYQPSPAVLELHALVVCTSATKKDPQLLEKAIERACLQDNDAICARGLKRGGDVDPNNQATRDEDKPLAGGDVRICGNCLKRERKRACRKKLKRDEEEAHWTRYETERIVVFNTQELKPWVPWKETVQNKDRSLPIGPIDVEPPSATAMQVVAPMRISCYCRHHGEKDGYLVIMTLKDYEGRVVAQSVTDSIHMTDDHKREELGPGGEEDGIDGIDDGAVDDDDDDDDLGKPDKAEDNPSPGPPLASSQSMVNLSSQVPRAVTTRPTGNKSTGNLQNLKARAKNARRSLQHGDTESGQTSGTVTPRMLSRPPSPNVSGQPGPTKKRKSTSGPTKHRRNTSGLMMTRIEKPQPQRHSMMSSSATNLASMNNAAPLTPLTSVTMSPTMTQALAPIPSFMSQPQQQVSHANQFQQHPITPNELPSNFFGLDADLSRTPSMDQFNMQAYFSAPSSAHASRAPSPTSRKASYGPSVDNAMMMAPSIAARSATGSAPNSPASPIVNKITPSEGPVTGGIEVSILGRNFQPNTVVMFGDKVSPNTTFYGERALCCIVPAGQAGPVAVRIMAPAGQNQPLEAVQGASAIFQYTSSDDNTDIRMMEAALRCYSLETTGSVEGWHEGAQSAASRWLIKVAAARGSVPPSILSSGLTHDTNTISMQGMDDLDSMINNGRGAGSNFGMPGAFM